MRHRTGRSAGKMRAVLDEYHRDQTPLHQGARGDRAQLKASLRTRPYHSTWEG
jgi:hypothetical protein